MALCNIIIPYYQSEEKILKRCLDSIISQRFKEFSIIIVDDNSPFPAADVVATLSDEQQKYITIINQKNAGPGAARNTGLNAIGDDAKMIAFLDSDDVWKVEHLERAHEAIINQGADLYWSTITINGMTESSKSFSQNTNADLEPIIESDLLRINNISSTLIKDWWKYYHLSGFVVSREIAQKVRFNTDSLYASEDLLYFFDASRLSNNCIVSDKNGFERLAGDNFYEGTDWGTRKSVKQMCLNIKATKIMMRSRHYREETDRAKLQSLLQEKRYNLLQSLKMYLRSKKDNKKGIMLFILKEDPSFYIYSLFRLIKKKIAT